MVYVKNIFVAVQDRVHHNVIVTNNFIVVCVAWNNGYISLVYSFPKQITLIQGWLSNSCQTRGNALPTLFYLALNAGFAWYEGVTLIHHCKKYRCNT
jgi:hypothetical protein